jgi:hypothetical protein
VLTRNLRSSSSAEFREFVKIRLLMNNDYSDIFRRLVLDIDKPQTWAPLAPTWERGRG